MSSKIPSHISQRAQLYRNLNRSDRTQRSASSNPSNPSDTTNGTSAASTASRPDLGEDLSTEEREMIHEKFPPSPETTMRLYGRDRGERQIRPETLGNQIDLRG